MTTSFSVECENSPFLIRFTTSDKKDLETVVRSILETQYMAERPDAKNGASLSDNDDPSFNEKRRYI